MIHGIQIQEHIRGGYYIYGVLEASYIEYDETLGCDRTVYGKYLHPDLVWRSSLAVPGKWDELVLYDTRKAAQEVLDKYLRLELFSINTTSSIVNSSDYFAGGRINPPPSGYLDDITGTFVDWGN